MGWYEAAGAGEPADRTYITVEPGARPPGFGKTTSPPLYWRGPMFWAVDNVGIF